MNILEYDSIKKFIETVGEDVEQYFGEDKAALVYLKPNGVWYAEGLREWLKKKGKDATFSVVDDDGSNLQEEKVRGRKVLIVDADITTGKAFKRSTGGVRARKKELGIQDIKFATYIDRVGLADFFVWKYSPEAIWHFDEMNVLDLKIFATLAKNGREAFANIGKEVNLSAVTVKNRVDRLRKEKIIDVRAQLHTDQFYSISAQIYVEADKETVDRLVGKFEKTTEVYHLVHVTGMYNLLIGVLGHSWYNIQAFIENEIRLEKGVKKVFITTGEVPLAPKTIPPKFS